MIFLTENPKKTEELPFPVAPIVRLMRKHLDKNKIIKKQVKEGMNRWLGKMCARVTEKINKKPYTTVDYHTFEEAIKVYNDVERMEKEKERIVISLKKIKEDCDALIMDLERRFKV